MILTCLRVSQQGAILPQLGGTLYICSQWIRWDLESLNNPKRKLKLYRHVSCNQRMRLHLNNAETAILWLCAISHVTEVKLSPCFHVGLLLPGIPFPKPLHDKAKLDPSFISLWSVALLNQCVTYRNLVMFYDAEYAQALTWECEAAGSTSYVHHKTHDLSCCFSGHLLDKSPATPEDSWSILKTQLIVTAKSGMVYSKSPVRKS